jgi:RNA polymerase sigma-70 factor (ECF subfamily)
MVRRIRQQPATNEVSAETASGGSDRAAQTPKPEVQPNDRAARFTELYEQYLSFVWRTVRYLGVPAEATDDAVQDVFLVAHRRLEDFEARSTPRTWLFAIALRVAKDQRRSRGRRLRLLEQAASIERVSSATPFDKRVSAELERRLMLALGQLREEQRLVFILAELEEMSVPEIAAALQSNLNTVYSRLRVARREMTRILRQDAAESRDD